MHLRSEHQLDCSPATELAPSPPPCLHQIFQSTALLYPDRIALELGVLTLTYGQLQARANQLASALQSHGAKPGCLVSILLPPSMEFYVSMLGTLKSGAAYVPLDPDYPSERIEFVLSDCQAQFLITTRALAQKIRCLPECALLLIEELDAPIPICTTALHPANGHPQALPVPGAEPDDLCYVIYTSGSSGRPKGVMITHQNATNFVAAEASVFQIKPHDRVLQAFSVAFDASVESIWLAFASGAALVLPPPEHSRDPDALQRQLLDKQITVFSSVPTFVSFLNPELPALRLLILGGEVCPQELIRRWWRPDRRIVNTYGPTETTVVATYTDCYPQRLVTIGRPLPGYEIAILDQNLQPVPAGTAGELCISGGGVAKGYVARPELTRERFTTAAIPSLTSPRIYRTGDMARLNLEGDIEFLGRLDSQIKLRGYRIELNEIESVLMDHPQVCAAAVTVIDRDGIQTLAAFVVPDPAAPISISELRRHASLRLPAYMVPQAFQCVSSLPLLPSGKIDRQHLPNFHFDQAAASGSFVPQTAAEQSVADVWQKFFSRRLLSRTADFFLDLGGHSLLAAQVVSELRKTPGAEGLAIAVLYQHPTIEGLARQIHNLQSPSRPDPAAARQNHGRPSSKDSLVHQPVPKGRHAFCAAAQALLLYPVLGFYSFQWLAPYLAYTWLVEDDYSKSEAIAGALLLLVGIFPAMLIVSIAVKWLVIGRFKPGAHPLWSWYYLRFWFVKTVLSAVPTQYLAGTPLLNIYFRLLGAKIGSNVFLATANLAVPDLVEINSHASIGTDAALLGYHVENGVLTLDRISVGHGCFVGTRSVLSHGASMGDRSKLGDLSMLPAGSRIPPGQSWHGSPAGPSTLSASGTATQPFYPSLLRRFAFGLLQTAGVALFPVLVIAAIFPGVVLMNSLNYGDDYYSYLIYSPLVALSFITLLAAEIVLVKWLLLGKVRPTHCRLFSWFHFRKWFVDQTMELSLDFLGPLYASIFLPPWYRLLGAKLGRRAEISTASFISPDLLSVGDESFIADSVSLGSARFEDGFLTIGPNHLGKRAFIGNSALLPPHTVVPDNALIGCLSLPPNPNTMSEDSSWIGSPAMFLPQRQQSRDFGTAATFQPSRQQWLTRAGIEAIRVLLPSTCFVVLSSLLLSAVVLIQERITLPTMLMLFPLLYAAAGLLACLIVVAAKWILAGRYRPGEKPLWCTFVWRNELINALHENLADLFLVGVLTGTPFVCWYFKALGAKIGPRVYMDTTDLTEFDLVQVEEEAALNQDCTLQTHLFEDRVMKMSSLTIGKRAAVSALALILYDTRMNESSVLGPLSLLMKGEVLPAHTRWHGSPAQPSHPTCGPDGGAGRDWDPPGRERQPKFARYSE